MIKPFVEPDRSLQPKTAHTLADFFTYVFPGQTITPIPRAEALKTWNAQRTRTEPNPKAVAFDDTIVAFIYSPASGEPAAAVEIGLRFTPTSDDALIARCLAKTFNEDLARCTESPQTDELWRTLLASTFLRAISRFVRFNPQEASHWIQTMEASMTLTYEGRPAHHSVLFCPGQSICRPRDRNRIPTLSRTLALPELHECSSLPRSLPVASGGHSRTEGCLGFVVRGDRCTILYSDAPHLR